MDKKAQLEDLADNFGAIVLIILSALLIAIPFLTMDESQKVDYQNDMLLVKGEYLLNHYVRLKAYDGRSVAEFTTDKDDEAKAGIGRLAERFFTNHFERWALWVTYTEDGQNYHSLKTVSEGSNTRSVGRLYLPGYDEIFLFMLQSGMTPVSNEDRDDAIDEWG